MASSNWSVSLIIPNYNGRQLLAENLPQVMAAARGAEVIVVDDASTDDSVAWLKQRYPLVRLVSLKQNRRFARACNAGVKAARGEIVVLLNNDVSPQVDFLTPLLAAFNQPVVAAAGCAELETINGRIRFSGRAGGRFERGLIRHWRARDQTGRDTFWVAGGSGAYRRELFLALGGFDPLFAPAYEEDRDLSYRLLKRGHQIKFVPESRVTHHHETTQRLVLGQDQMQLASYKNSLILVWKNLTDWRLSLSHLVWLPYHLLITSIMSRGLFLKGLIQALTVIKPVLKKRALEKKAAQIRDQAILTQVSLII